MRNKAASLRDRLPFRRFLGWLIMVLIISEIMFTRPLSAEESLPFTDAPVTENTTLIRQAFFEGDLPKMADLLSRADRSEPAIPALDLGLRVAKVDLVDPLSILLHTHSFVDSGFAAGAFLPNGNEDPVKIIDREARAIINADPKAAPHVADALCLAVALQLTVAVKEGGYIALDDDVLFTMSQTSAEPKLFETLACEVLCSNAESRERQRELIRSMFIQQLQQLQEKRENTIFFEGGLWIQVKSLATKIDEGSRNRWAPIFESVARQCAEKSRYTSGILILIHGAHAGTDGAWKYLLQASNTPLPKPDRRAATNLKIAFAYLAECLRIVERPLPDDNDETFKSLRKNLNAIGDQTETKIAMEAAGLK
jgi:hypothetical protein